MNYICNSDFHTTKGHYYNYKDSINEWEYDALHPNDQRFFDEEDEINDFITNIIPVISLASEMFDNTIDDDVQDFTPLDEPQTNDDTFGGGDFGGGGASSDF